MTVAAGGTSRQQSVYAGLRAVTQPVDLVAVHDGVRPLLEPSLLERTLAAAWEHGAATAAVPLKDTVKLVESGWVQSTPPRARLRAVQTPQAFRRNCCWPPTEEAAADGIEATDDASLVERAGHPVAIIDGTYANIKITTPEDLLVAEALLAGEDRRGDGREPRQRRCSRQPGHAKPDSDAFSNRRACGSDETGGSDGASWIRL